MVKLKKKHEIGIVPELEEPSISSPLNGLKEPNNYKRLNQNKNSNLNNTTSTANISSLLNNSITSSNNTINTKISANNSSNKQTTTMNNANSNRTRLNSVGQQDLTLPPIVESHVLTKLPSSRNVKKSQSINRLDGNQDLLTDRGGGGNAASGLQNNTNNHWTLSSNASDNDVEMVPLSEKTNGEVVITTVEMVDNNSSLKKNQTSSTLNSFGKSSSIQSRLTATTNSSNKNNNIVSNNFNTTNNQFTVSSNSSAGSKANFNTKSNIINVNGNEAGHKTGGNIQSGNTNQGNYLESLERLYTLNGSDADVKSNLVINHNNIIISNNQTAPPTNSRTEKFIAFDLGKNTKISNDNSSVNNMKTTQARKSIHDLNSQNTNRTNQTNNQISSNDNQQKRQSLVNTRQNTNLTINPANNNSDNPKNSTVLSNQSQVNKPVVKPRKMSESVKQRSTSLIRQNTFAAPNNVNSENVSNYKNNLANIKEGGPSPINIKNDAKNKFVLSPNNINSNRSNNNNNNTTNNDSARPKTTGLERNRIASLKTNLEEDTAENDQDKVDDYLNNDETNNATKLILPKYPDDSINSENNLSEYTISRIVRWLKDIEKCTTMIKPPSQLTWANRASEHNAHLHNSLDNPHKMSNEYCLSDFDSLDDQIIEYNRIVDKTFHIVHFED